MIYVTGDTHGDFSRLSPQEFPLQEQLSETDYVIICGDCGLIWDSSDNSIDEIYWKKWLAARPFTLLFIDGNHENFDRLNAMPAEEWNGGRIHRISDHVLHLMRGQIFCIDGISIFTLGGAASHDIGDGIINLDEQDLHWRNTAKRWRREGRSEFRVNHVSWWKEEVPNEDEINAGIRALAAHGNAVDCILTHEALASDVTLLGGGCFRPDHFSQRLEEIKRTVSFRHWYFGHYHTDARTDIGCTCLYRDILPIAGR